MNCSECRMYNDPGRRVCQYCGAKLPEETPPERRTPGTHDTLVDMPPDEEHEKAIPFAGEDEALLDLPELPYAVGIDLGTTNSVVAVYRNGRPETLEIEGARLLPSVVSFRDAKTVLVGKHAKSGLEIHPEATVTSIKRQMGNTGYRAIMFGQSYTPADISAMVLKKLVDGASRALGGRIRKVVITVPAYFNSNQNEDTLKAARKAGLEVLQLLPEPTAAAIAYGLDKQRNQTLLVYDLGGGTFDVCILKVANRDFKAIAVGGNAYLGGDDFDIQIMSFLVEELKAQTGIDLRTDESLQGAQLRKAWQLLKESAERAKKELSAARTAFIEIPNLVRGESLNVELTRERFEELIRPVATETVQPIRQALQDAGLDAEDVDRVILVGGSSKVPLVQTMVKEMIRDPFIADSVDEMVAHGAAIVASSLVAPEPVPQPGGTQGRSINWDATPPGRFTFQNITSHSLGVQVTDEAGFHFAFSKIINRNSPLPVLNARELYSTVTDFQTAIRVRVFQGEDYDCRTQRMAFLGEFEVEGIQRAHAGVPQIEVSFTLTKDDILQVSAKDLTTGAAGGRQVNVRRKFDPRSN